MKKLFFYILFVFLSKAYSGSGALVDYPKILDELELGILFPSFTEFQKDGTCPIITALGSVENKSHLFNLNSLNDSMHVEIKIRLKSEESSSSQRNIVGHSEFEPSHASSSKNLVEIEDIRSMQICSLYEHLGFALDKIFSQQKVEIKNIDALSIQIGFKGFLVTEGFDRDIVIYAKPVSFDPWFALFLSQKFPATVASSLEPELR